MSPDTWLESLFVVSLGWAIVHSLWQVLAITLVLVAGLPALRRHGPQVTSVVCCLALCLSLSLLVMTFVMCLSTAKPNEASRGFVTQQPPLETTPVLSGQQIGVTFEIGAAERPIIELESEGQQSKLPIPISDNVNAFIAEATTAPPSNNLGPRHAWFPLIVASWFVGVLLLSIWNCAAWFAAKRLTRTAILPVTAHIEQAVARMAFDLGLRRSVRVLQSMIVKSPVVIGAWKPVILLPVSLILELPPDQVEALLAHELAHVLRQDYLINLLQTTIETLLFYHPGVWWISRQVRIEREHCCDDLALRLTEDRTVYAKALAAVAGVRTPTIMPAASGGLLVERLQRILGVARPEPAHPARWMAGLTLLLLCGIVTGVCLQPERTAVADSQVSQSDSTSDESKPDDEEDAVAGLNDLDAYQGAQSMSMHLDFPTDAGPLQELIEPQATTTGAMRVRVVGPDGNPLPNSKLHASIWTDEKGFGNHGYETDNEGVCIIRLPKTLTILRVWVSQEGHCPLFIEWWPKERPDEQQIPAEFTFSMEKGTTIAGFIKNSDGQPVANARIQVHFELEANENKHQYRYNGALADGESPEIDQVNGPRFTDDQGRWTLDNVPAETNAKINLFLTHPDYISDQHWGGIQNKQKITLEALRNQTATITLERGTSVTGRVLDPAGQPVANAVVIWGEDPVMQPGRQEVRSDADGRYRIPAFPPGRIRVTVVAKDWMPDSRIIAVRPGMPDYDISLKQGKPLKVQAVDSTGKPLSDVDVEIERWRQSKALYNSNRSEALDLQIPNKTDGQGVFVWDWAPDDGVSYVFYKEGYSPTSQTLVAGDASPKTIVLRNSAPRATTISGIVRDATTGTRIDRFLMIPVDHFDEHSSLLERTNARAFTAGQFAYSLFRNDIKVDLQIEAPGYRVFRTSGRYRLGDKSDVLDVQLEPIGKYTGRVISPEGNPVKAANAFIGTASQEIKIHNLDQRIRAEEQNYVVRSDSAGGFEIVPQRDDYSIVVIANEGYAEVTRKAAEVPGEIHLKRWAKLTGRLVQSGKPVPDFTIDFSTIDVYAKGIPHIANQQTTVTDADGRFVFERIPPTASSVSPRTHFNQNSILTSSRSFPMNPAPGETVYAAFGEEGAEITGQLVVEQQPKTFPYQISRSYLIAKRPGVVPPPSLTGKGFEQRLGWSEYLFGTVEGTQYLRLLDHWLVKPTASGKIRISGVAPGEYDLLIALHGSSDRGFNHPIAKRVIPVSIKSGQRQVDLGQFVIPAHPIAKVGDTAPDLQFTDANGKQRSLASEQEKYRLISFWASWSDYGLNQINDLEQLRQQFEQSHQLVVIGANLDENPEKARSLLKSKDISWPQAFLGDWSKSNVPRQFGVDFLPTYVLIDPKGKIAAHTFSLEEITKTLNAQKSNRD